MCNPFGMHDLADITRSMMSCAASLSEVVYEEERAGGSRTNRGRVLESLMYDFLPSLNILVKYLKENGYSEDDLRTRVNSFMDLVLSANTKKKE